jgi:hypothetical protein
MVTKHFLISEHSAHEKHHTSVCLYRSCTHFHYDYSFLGCYKVVVNYRSTKHHVSQGNRSS